MKNPINVKTVAINIGALFTLLFVYSLYAQHVYIKSIFDSLTDYRTSSQHIIPQPSPIISPTPLAEVTHIQADPPVKIPQTSEPQLPWGKAEKVDDVTYTIRVGYDAQMTTPQELLEALNQYRRVHSRGTLNWDDTLAVYAQERAQTFQNNGSTDKHAGFDSFLENEDGFNKLGYSRLGENSYYGGPLTGTHLIEWVFSQSPGHDANQLDNGWTHVGVGTTNNAVNLIFGKK